MSGQDLAIVAGLVAIAVARVLILDVCARFTYTLSGHALVMRLHVLGIVPWSARTIPFSHIEQVRGGFHPRWLGAATCPRASP